MCDSDCEQSGPHYGVDILRPGIKRYIVNADWANCNEDQCKPSNHVECSVHGRDVKSDDAKKNPEKDCKANLDFLVADGHGVFCGHFFISIIGFDVVIIPQPETM